MEKQEQKLLEAPDRSYNIEGNSIPNESFDKIASVMDYEKEGETIKRELEEYRGASSSEKETINEEIVKDIEEEVEEEVEFDLDDLGNDAEPYEGNTTPDGEEDLEVAVEEDIEDYMDSAEFIIFIVELVIVWGTNFYLKKNDLDSIALEEFEKTQRQQKALIKAWAKILMKHSVKVGPEFELLFLMGSTYGMKVKGIVKAQKERKELQLKNLTRKPRKKAREKVIHPSDIEEANVPPFSLNTDSEENEEKPTVEKKVKKKKSGGGNIGNLK
jgi:hypothetical protein